MGEMVKGKVVIVTGAGRGIGREFARAFAANGAKVVVNDVEMAAGKSSAQAVVNAIRDTGGTAVASTDSVADPDAAARIVGCALDSYGRSDCVVNNAGIVRDEYFYNMSVDAWRSVIDVHLNGSFYVARAAASHFKAQNAGCFIHMTSASGLIGNIGQANYSAAKLAIVALSKSIALDMAQFNVRSNCIAPWAWTAMTATIPATEENAARIAMMQKMGAAKIAPLAVCLASDAAVKVSGQILGVRANEIYLFDQIRIIRSVHRSEGWTPESIAEHALPALEASFFANVVSPTLTPWEPI
jgi:NAD(P)-dependent dehydrogenase (short-subunit alcohol dehydrogenase family)